MENRNEFYVYAWVYEDSNIPFYVGKGKGDRWKRKDSRHRSKEFIRIISENKCKLVIIIPNLCESDAKSFERILIKAYKEADYPLINNSEGGDGGTSGWKQSEEIKHKYSFMFQGESNPNYNHKWSEEMKQSLSDYFTTSGKHAGANNGRCRPVMCVETGERFEYMGLIIERLGLKSIESIAVALRHPQRTAKGFHFVEGKLMEELDTEEKRKSYLQTLKKRPIAQ